MVYAFYIFTYTLLLSKLLIMKPIYKIIFVCITFFCCIDLFAQIRHNIVKQTQRTNGILNATANANANARIHANSNSVFGAANNPPSYKKKDQPKNDEIKLNKEVQKHISPKNKKDS